MKNKSYDKRMLAAGLLVLLFCVVCLVEEMSSNSWEAEYAKMVKVTSTPTPKVKATSTPKPKATNTPTPTVSKAKNNVKLFFETEKIEITSKEQKETVILFLQKNDFDGKIYFDENAT